MLRPITGGRFAVKSNSCAESPTPVAASTSCFNLTFDVKPLEVPGAGARASHRLRGRRVSVERLSP